MTNYASHYAKRGPTPQTSPIPGRTDQVENNAGGYVFSVGDWAQLDRFLLLGSSGGTYYVGERELTIDNAKCVERCIKEDGPRVVARIVEISDAGRAPKNDPALFALALCAAASDVKTRQAALAALSKVARIGTFLFSFAGYVQGQRGWGRSLRRAIATWYNVMSVDKLAMQAVKYQNRSGWSHRDLLRLAHPLAAADDYQRRATYDWICGRKPDSFLPPLIAAYEGLKADPTVANAIRSIKEQGLPREAIPTELLNDVTVWEALLEDMPLTAMVRNLGKMTSIGAIKPLSASVTKVVTALTDQGIIQKARMHPIALLLALKTYANGHGDKGKLSWSPVGPVMDALDKSFYLAFKSVVPTGKRILLALDVSGSMGSGTIAGTSLTPREGTAALALVTAATESNYHIVGFSHELVPINISPTMRLDSVCQTLVAIPMGGTDCAAPMQYALRNKLEVDAFITYTDNETWAGTQHFTQALDEYRKKTGIAAKSIVVGMTSTGFTINDPADPLGLDVCGFDSATPSVIADFIRG